MTQAQDWTAINLLTDAEGNLYEVPAGVLAPYKIDAARQQELLSTHRQEDVQGFWAQGYTVQPGDSLWAIAQRTYGDGRLWPVLYAANADRVRNPNLIYSGQALRIP